MSLYRIMLVDDEEEVRKAMIRSMDWEQLGFTVAGDAENGGDALEKLEQFEPDVVMSDIRMLELVISNNEKEQGKGRTEHEEKNCVITGCRYDSCQPSSLR